MFCSVACINLPVERPGLSSFPEHSRRGTLLSCTFTPVRALLPFSSTSVLFLAGNTCHKLDLGDASLIFLCASDGFLSTLRASRRGCLWLPWLDGELKCWDSDSFNFAFAGPSTVPGYK